MSAETLISRLEKVQPRGSGQWMARCPAHEDKNPSLSIRETSDATVLIKCFAGCNVTDVIDAVGMEIADLFPPRIDHHNNHFKGRPRLDGWVALRAMSRHLIVILAAADQLRRGEPLSDADMDTLCDAAGAIERIKGESRVIA